MKAWAVIRSILGKLTDILTLGRAAGLWTEKQNTGPISIGNPHDPTFPDQKK